MLKRFLAGLAMMFILVGTAIAADGSKPTIYNTTLTSADTEYSQVITPGTKKLTLQCRTNYDIRIAFVTGKVAGSTSPYMTLKKGAVYWEDNLRGTFENPITVYLASSQAGVIIEIVVWR